jgi:hypothetical protein
MGPRSQEMFPMLESPSTIRSEELREQQRHDELFRNKRNEDLRMLPDEWARFDAVPGKSAIGE